MIHLRYLTYVLRHKWYVFQECLKLGVPLWIALAHDISKFLPSEWLPYVHYFYGNGRTREDGDNSDINGQWLMEFEYAWNHHQKCNKHHWQYWIRLGDDGTTLLLEMPSTYLYEMLADWRGAGRALGKPNTRSWYLQNRDKMQLHAVTRARVKQLLGISEAVA